MNTFEITIQRKIGDCYDIVVEYTLTDSLLPVRAEGKLSIDFDELRRKATPLEYGTFLGEALFRDKVLRAFDRARAESQRSGDGLRILLFVEDQELRTLRWERLCISTDDSWSLDGTWDFLTLNQQLPFSLYLPSTIDRRFLPIGKRDLQALVVVANPEDLESWGLAPFDVAATVSAVKTALGEIPHDVLAMVDGAVGAPTLDELSKKLVEKPYTLLHFVCHGQIIKQGELKGETQIYLSDANNQVDPVEGKRLLNTLRNTRITRLPHFTFFCTCHSANPEAEGAFGGLAQRLVRELGMPAVVAMTKEVSIKTAEALSGRFYERLREHGYVDSALVEATGGLDSRFDITVPALFSRLGGRPLFSDKLDRPLTDEEIKFGLSRLHDLLVRDKRAPILQEIFETQAANLLRTIGAQSDVAKEEREEARKWINQICGEVLDLSFRSVALNEAVPPYDDRCPFRGLYPFHLEDREFFFGREALIEQLQQKLTEHNFLALLGSSGSGKSSVVLAGLIPALQKQEPDLQMVYLTPSSNPLAQLEVSLAKVQGRSFIIVVDQFEELFTLCTNEADRRTFINRLLTLLQNQKIVITMRADFWGECAPYQELKNLMEARQKLIAPMNVVELRRSMERQATEVGLRFEAGLSNLVLDEVQAEPGAMPLLQHALLELWKRRHGRWLSRSEYEKIGGVKQAIAKTADDFYENLQTDVEREQIRNIFVRLTRLDKTAVQGEQRRDTRRRIDIEDFGGDPTAIKKLVLQLADAKVRLVVTSLNETTKSQQVEVAHEALIRHWTRLGKWLDDNRIILQLIERLNQEAEDWSDAGKKDEFLLLQGGRLDDAAKLKNQTKFTLNQLEQDYIDACVALQESEKIETQRQRDEAIRGQITALAALSKSSFAADEQLEALVAAVKAATQIKREPQLQKELGAEVIEALQQAVYGIQERNRLEGNTDPVKAVCFCPDGKTLATGNWDNTVKIWRIDGTLLKTFEGHTGQVNTVAYNSDGSLLASGSDDKTVKIWHLESGILSQTLQGHTTSVADVNFKPNSEILASTSTDGAVKVWSAGSGNLIQQFQSHTGETRTVFFSSDADLIVTGGWDQPRWTEIQKFWKHDGSLIKSIKTDGTCCAMSRDKEMIITTRGDGHVDVIKTSDGELLERLGSHTEWVMDSIFSPDEQLVASVGIDKTAQIWTRDGHLYKILRGHNDAVYSVAFSPDGETLATASADRTVRLWKVQGPALRSLDGVPGSAHLDVCFSSNGKLMASASFDRIQSGWTVKLWNSNGEFLRTLAIHNGPVRTVRFSPDSQLVASASWDGTIKVCRIDGEVVTTFAEHGQPILNVVTYDERSAVNGVDFSSDGKVLASVGYDRHIRIWNLAGTQLKVIPNPHADQSYRIEFSPDGKTFATASWDRTVKLWSVEGELLHTLRGHSNWLYGLSFSGDGKLLASAGLDRVIRIWSTEGKLLQTLEGHRDGIYDLCFGPNSQVIASASLDGTIRLWDITGALLKTITGHTNAVYGVSFSPDGKTIASASWDGSIKLWSAETESFEELLQCGCGWLGDYLRTNPNVSEADRHICCNGENFGTTVLST